MSVGNGCLFRPTLAIGHVDNTLDQGHFLIT
jgi:hypothetical protein